MPSAKSRPPRPPRPRPLPVDTERAAFLGDWHCPLHDPVAVEIALEFLRWFKPDTVFVLGDFLDLYALSKYDQDPELLLSFQSELDAGHALLVRLRRACPRATVHYLNGNHENRLQKFLWQNPRLSKLKNLSLPSLLGLADLGITHHDYSEQLQWHGLLVEHGDMVRKKSAATAAGMLEKRGVSGISGHSHRLGAHYRSDHSGVKVWYENGCLCRLRPEYRIGVPDWQQGFSVGFGLQGRGRFLVEQVPILSHRLFYQGHVWEG